MTNGQVTNQVENRNTDVRRSYSTGELPNRISSPRVAQFVGGQNSQSWGLHRRPLGTDSLSEDWKKSKPKIGTEFHFY